MCVYTYTYTRVYIHMHMYVYTHTHEDNFYDYKTVWIGCLYALDGVIWKGHSEKPTFEFKLHGGKCPGHQKNIPDRKRTNPKASLSKAWYVDEVTGRQGLSGEVAWEKDAEAAGSDYAGVRRATWLKRHLRVGMLLILVFYGLLQTWSEWDFLH